ncbi:MAG: hypothetical protein J5I50_00175 [Chitinophagaceae bacterium]|nr:hypothetical protein [Chitinophagaceae bacterium]
MKNVFLLIMAGLFFNSAPAQINITDSSAQAITYWDKGESHIYTVKKETFRVVGPDTSLNEVSVYEVEITVLDQTDSSYLIRWSYRNGFTNTRDTILHKLLGVSAQPDVIYRTDETGIFKEVVNYEELRDEVKKAAEVLKSTPDLIPGMDSVVDDLIARYSTKEAIESFSMKDIQQYHLFYGVSYSMGEELEVELKLPNVLGGQPYDAVMLINLEEIDDEHAFYVLSALQQVDPQQLENSVLKYLNSVAEKVGGAPAKPEDLRGLKNEVLTVSSIHDSGWLLFSQQTTTVSLGDIVKIERRTIRIKDDDED